MRNCWIIAALTAAIGLVWIGQGSGLLRGSSFMTDDVRWAIAGGFLLLVAAVVAWTAVRARSRP